MNLITSIRMQLNGMNDWYKNALITNVILDYLELETESAQRNIEIITQLIDSRRIKALFEGPKDIQESFYVDGIRVLSIFKTETEVVNGLAEARKPVEMHVHYKFQIDYIKNQRKK